MSFDLDLLMQSINFHGHDLLKKIVAKAPIDVGKLNPQDLNFKSWFSRTEEIKLLGTNQTKEIVDFIANKSSKLLTKQLKDGTAEQEQDDLYTERCNHQLPYEYFMKLPLEIRVNRFYEVVKVGDILYGEVCNFLPTLTILDFIGFAKGTHRYFYEKEIQLCMKNEDSIIPSRDQDRFGNWIKGTKLCVEVLSVPDPLADKGDGKRVFVGTNGITLSQELISSGLELGKISSSVIPLCLREPPDSCLKYLSESLENLPSFKNPRSIKQAAAACNVDLKSYPTLMSTLIEEFPESQKAPALRKTQICKWAHKNVADGVIAFKKGHFERAFHYLNKAIQIDSENVEAFVARGALLANLGKYEKAIDNFETALKFKSDHSNAKKYLCETLVELGKQFETEGNLKEAKNYFNRCYELDRDHATARDSLRSILRKLGEDDMTKPIQENPVIDENFLAGLLNMGKDIEKLLNDKKDDIDFISTSLEDQQHDETEKLRETRIKEPSLSPFSLKMAQQENLWAPLPNISQNETFVASSSSTIPAVDLQIIESKSQESADVLPQSIPMNYSEQEIVTKNWKPSNNTKEGKLSEKRSHSRSKNDEKPSSKKDEKYSKGSKKRKKDRRRKNSGTSDSSRSSNGGSSSTSSDEDYRRRDKKSKKKKYRHHHKKQKKEDKKKDKSSANIIDGINISNMEKLEAKLNAYYSKLADIQSKNQKSEKKKHHSKDKNEDSVDEKPKITKKEESESEKRSSSNNKHKSGSEMKTLNEKIKKNSSVDESTPKHKIDAREKEKATLNDLLLKGEDDYLPKLPPISNKIRVHPLFLMSDESNEGDELAVSQSEVKNHEEKIETKCDEDTSKTVKDEKIFQKSETSQMNSANGSTSHLRNSRRPSVSKRRSNSRSKHSGSRSPRRMSSKRRSCSRSLRRSRSRYRSRSPRRFHSHHYYKRYRTKRSRSPRRRSRSRDRYHRERSYSKGRSRFSRSRSRESKYSPSHRGYHHRKHFYSKRGSITRGRYSYRRKYSRSRSRSRTPTKYYRGRSRSRSRSQDRDFERLISTFRGNSKNNMNYDEDRRSISSTTADNLVSSSTADAPSNDKMSNVSLFERFGKWATDIKKE